LGIYSYSPQGKNLTQLQAGDRRSEFVDFAGGQGWVKTAPATFAITGIFERAAKNGVGKDYVCVEAGPASQNFAGRSPPSTWATST